MRGKEFLEKMALAAPAYIEEAGAPPKKTRLLPLRAAAAAACLVLLACAGLTLLPGQSTPLPLLSVSPMDADAMGYEGYMAYDASELVSANPWHAGMDLEALPVYRNTLRRSETMRVENPDFDAMRALLLDIARGLGFSEDALAVRDDVPDAETQRKITEKFASVGEPVPADYFAPGALIGEAEGVRIEVDATMSARILFTPAVNLPAPLRFSHDATYEELTAVAAYLLETYRDLIGFAEPQTDIHGGDYNIYGQQLYSLSFFEGAGDDTVRLLQYNFERITFGCDDEEKLFLIRLERPDLSEKLGDYPLLTPDEALERLAAGQYLTTVPYELPGTDYVKKTELIYRTGPDEPFYMPYYRFYVELPEAAREGGLRDYGAYYVPAVAPQYLAQTP